MRLTDIKEELKRMKPHSINSISFKMYQGILKYKDCPEVTRYPDGDIPNNMENCDEYV